YDLISYFIDTLESQKDVLKQPDLEFLLVKKNIIFDHLAKKSYLVSYEFLENDEKADISAKKEELAELEREILEKEKNSAKHDDAIAEEEISSNLSKEEFMENVRIAKRYIREGDIFQVVLSQRLKTRLFNADDSFKIFENLLEINPSPYMYYLNFGERKLIGSSPEMLVRVENKEAITFPIAGTRKRGETAEEDKELERDLLRDEKERAEHVMLVDLARNDIGKVAKFGSVKVTRFMEIEKYSHVMHLVSEVKGELRDDKDALDAFKAVFPAGTVSGAPKVRAMEIISELEEEKRGIYAGSVGYVSFNGNLDSAIAIRTITLEKKDAYVQVGAGIVADSIPAKEYEETLNKGLALIKALSKNEKKSFSC
ncbi:MAG: anthranilate synthase component I, partial [Candidatus Altiarchaeales archaeon]